MAIPKIHTAFDPPPDVENPDWGPSLTRQEYVAEADINNIINQYQTNGILPETRPEGVYGDFTDPVLTNYQEAKNLVIGAQELFDALPARTRERFANDPAALFMFVQDPNNRDEAYKLGLLREDYVSPSSPPQTPTEPVK